ncbi:MAG: ATP-binding cassette domain-containing protein, partial [Lachnospiraceae bacterium]|nr:ATP-binding cassette domain-containing protein [Lachnospiraceae bacterium]
MADKILDIRDLDITFKTTAGPVHAIRGVNVDLERGETVAIVGESGSGKSVVMKTAMGILAGN